MKKLLLLFSTIIYRRRLYSNIWINRKSVKSSALLGTLGTLLLVFMQPAQALLPEPTEPCPETLQSVKLVDDTCGSNPTPVGPTRAPSVPSALTYLSYTNANNLTIQWSASNGYGYPVTYELQQSINGGTYKSVYKGSSTKTTLSNLTRAKYTYRVLARNSAYTSSFKSGTMMVVNPKQNYDLYQKYPFLTTQDQITAANHLSAPSFPTIIARAPTNSTASSQARIQGAGDSTQRFYLGDGYDLIRGVIKETCLDVNHPNFQIVQSTPMEPTVFEVTYINDNRHLAQELEVSESMAAGIIYDDISAGFQGERDKYVKSITDEHHIRFVVKIKNRKQFWKLNTPTDAIIPELTSKVLMPNNEEAKADFRERCGDNFISSANLGTALYVVFDFDAKKFSKEERETKKGELGIKIAEVFSFSGAASSSSSFQQTLDSLNVTVFASQIGGVPGLAASINRANVLDKYNEFVKNNDMNLWSAVDFTTSNYQRPTVYSAYAHEQIFAKYTGTQGPLAQMKRWLDISVQHRSRCQAWTDYTATDTEPAYCSAADRELSIVMDTCRETREWANCVHPANYLTGDLSVSPGVRLYDWMNTNSPKLMEESTSAYYNHHTYKDPLQVNDQTCLASTSCFGNIFKGNIDSAPGATVTNHYYDNPKGSGRTYRTTAPQHCVTSMVELRPKKPLLGLTDTTADWRYTMVFEGMCPRTQNYVLVQ